MKRRHTPIVPNITMDMVRADKALIRSFSDFSIFHQIFLYRFGCSSQIKQELVDLNIVADDLLSVYFLYLSEKHS